MSADSQSPVPPLSDLVAKFDATAFQSALEEAFRRGLVAGEAAEKARVAAALGLTAPSAPAASRPAAPPPQPQVAGDTLKAWQVFYRHVDEDAGRRAPRGLTREVVAMVLRDAPDGLPLDMVQSRAVGIDRRLSPKTVYNELNRERDLLYTFQWGRWRLIDKPEPKEEAPTAAA